MRAVDKATVDAARPRREAGRPCLRRSDVGVRRSDVDRASRPAVTPDVDDPSADELELAIVSRVLDAAAEVGVSHVCVLSTAMVYGAWVDNPVPLTEDADVRPNPDFPWAITRAAVERAVLEWGSGREAAVSILRPTAVVTDDTLEAARTGAPHRPRRHRRRWRSTAVPPRRRSGRSGGRRHRDPF